MNRSLRVINISIVEFTRRLFKSGGISVKGFFLLFIYYIQFIPSLLFGFMQFLIFSSRINKTIVSKDPIFILGHYRCGTSYLQKLLVSDKRFGYLTYYEALFPNTNLLFGKKMQLVLQWIIKVFNIKNPFFHDSVLKLSEPDEEDDYLMNKASAFSAYWGFIFPKKWKVWLNGLNQFSDSHYMEGWKNEYMKTIRFLTYKNNGKQLILKNPPNTERIGILLQMFPNAKFIHIHRNPLNLYSSIKNMWENVILKYYSFQVVNEKELDEIIYEHFNYLTTKYENDKHLIPIKNRIEISYEELRGDPCKTVQNIYSHLHLPEFGLTENDLRGQLELEKEYRVFQYQSTENDFQKIKEKWGKFIRLWNYKIPET